MERAGRQIAQRRSRRRCVSLLRPRAGSNAIWRDRCIEHARARFGIAFVKDLNDYLRQEGLSDGKRIGALRLAGAHWRQ